MKVSVQCEACGHAWVIGDEPRALAPLVCPQCHVQAHAAAAEDFASALEDVLAQLHQLSQTHRIDVQLSSAHIPAAFVPEAPKQKDP